MEWDLAVLLISWSQVRILPGARWSRCGIAQYERPSSPTLGGLMRRVTALAVTGE